MSRIDLIDLPSREEVGHRLRDLLDRYPPTRDPEGFDFRVDRLSLGEEYIGLVKVKAIHPSGQSVLGSGGAVNRFPVRRAYFELVERANQPRLRFGDDTATVRLLGADGEVQRRESLGDVLPVNPDPQQWRVSPTNGMAAHVEFESALRGSTVELVERDRVLRNWFAGEPPGSCGLEQLEFLSGNPILQEEYDFAARSFEPCSTNLGSYETCVVAGFPRTDGALIYGFGSGNGEPEALHHAEQECVQRLGFQRVEVRPTNGGDTGDEPSPERHRDFFASPEGADRFHQWLHGELPLSEKSFHGSRNFTVCWLDCTPAHLDGKAHVLKALSPGAVPLTHGRGHPWVTDPLPEPRQLHPMA